MNNLPRCLKQYITHFLDFNSLLKMRQINKYYYNLLPITWLPKYIELVVALDFKYPRALEHIKKFTYCCTERQNLDFSMFKELEELYITSFALESINNLPPSLIKLEVQDSCKFINLKGLQLQSLTFVGAQTTDLPASLTELNAIALPYTIDLYHLTNLKILDISHTQAININAKLESFRYTMTSINNFHDISCNLTHLSISNPVKNIYDLNNLTTLVLDDIILDFNLPPRVKNLFLSNVQIQKINVPIEKLTLSYQCILECQLPTSIKNLQCIYYEYNLPKLEKLICEKVISPLPDSLKTLCVMFCENIGQTKIEKLIAWYFDGSVPETLRSLKFIQHAIHDNDHPILFLEHTNIKKLVAYQYNNIITLPKNLEYLELNYSTNLSHLQNLKTININKYMINSNFPEYPITYKFDSFSSKDLQFIKTKIINRLIRPLHKIGGGHILNYKIDVEILKQLEYKSPEVLDYIINTEAYFRE